MEGFNEKFPTGVRRKELIAKNAENINRFKVIGPDLIRNHDHYTWVDSDLEDDGSSFDRSFQSVLPRDEEVYKGHLRDYVEHTLAPRRGEALGVEFGGPATNLFGGFTSHFFKKTVGVTLVDVTMRDGVAGPGRAHTVLKGDILSPETYKSLGEVFGGQKVDFIIERMAKGLEFMPPEPHTLGRILQQWYAMLREGGVMFVQTPVAFNALLDKWGETVRKEYKNKIDLAYSTRGKENHVLPFSVFRLHKLPGAPEQLPMLDARSVRSTPKTIYDFWDTL